MSSVGLDLTVTDSTSSSFGDYLGQKDITYDDIDTSASGNGQWVISSDAYNDGGSYATAIATDFSSGVAFMLYHIDTNAVDNSDYLDTLEVNDIITFWVSSGRWYEFRVDTIDATPPTNKYNLAVTFLREDITDGESAIPGGAGQNVLFKFNKTNNVNMDV